MRALLASLLVLSAQALGSSSVQAASLQFAIDLSFPFETIPEAGSVGGVFLDAGSFRVESSLLPSFGSSLVAFGQISDFTLTLPDFAISAQHLAQGGCLSSAQLPFCGLLFSEGTLQGLVGQFSMPTSDLRFRFRLDNTSPSLFDPGRIFQGAAIEALGVGTVASGFVRVRPVPEPVSALLFSTGSAFVGLTLRRRLRPRSAPGVHVNI